MKRLLLVLGLVGTPSVADAGWLVLPHHVLRLDVGTTGFTTLESGAVGGRRGFHVVKDGPGRAALHLGLGASIGLFGGELGVLFAPLVLSSGDKYGDVTAHARYGAYSSGDLQIAAQATVRIPTDSTTALGLGAPVFIGFGGFELRTGAELEVVFRDGLGATASLDVPVTILRPISNRIRVGLTTGLFLPEFDALQVPLGVVADSVLVAFAGGGQIQARTGFVLDRFVSTGSDGPFVLDAWTLFVGLSFVFGI